MYKGTKIKRILPSLREKKRYVAFEVISDQKLNRDEVNEAIFDANLGYLGELDCAKANLSIFGYDEKAKKGIIKVNNHYIDYVKASLALIKRIKNSKVIIKTIGVSGILKKLKSKYLAY